MLSLSALRHRWPAFAATFLALSAGVAMITAALLVQLSAGPVVPDRLAGAPVYVRGGETPWTAETVRELNARLRALPGVAEVIPDRPFYAQLVLDGRPVGRTERDDRQGNAWSAAALAPYPLRSGRPPAAAGELVAGSSLGVAAGARVTVLTAAGPSVRTVTGTVDGTGLYVPDAEAERLAGGVRLIGVREDAGAVGAVGVAGVAGVADAVSGVVRELGEVGEVLAGERRTALEWPSRSGVREIGAQVLSATVTLAAFSSVFVTASTFAVSAGLRRREFGLLRAVGATPRQVRRAVLGEALGVAAVAGAVGAAAGVALAPVFGGLLAEVGFEPPDFRTVITAWPPLLAWSAGLLVAAGGAWSAARRAGTVGPVEALREAGDDRRPMGPVRRVIGGALALSGAALVAVVVGAEGQSMVTSSLLAAMTLLTAVTVLAPAVVPPVVRAVGWTAEWVGGWLPARWFGRGGGATGMLVRESALGAVRRTASTAAPVIVTVGFAVLILGQSSTMAEAYRSRGTGAAQHQTVVRPDGTPGLSDAVLDALPADRTTAFTSIDVRIDGAAGLVAAVDPAAFRPKVLAGSLAGFGAPGTAVATEAGGPPGGQVDGAPGGAGGGAAGGATPGVGDTVAVTFADGRAVSHRVVAVVGELETPGLVLPRSVVRAHDPDTLTGLALVDGVRPEELRGTLAGLGATAVAGADYQSDSSAREDRLIRIFVLLLIAVSVGYTGLAVVNTLVLAVSGRRRDFAVLRLSGATAGQVRRVVAAEAALVAGIGAGLGAAVAVAALLGVRAGLTADLGRPVELLLPAGPVVSVVAACVGLAVVASVLAARPSVRRPD
ncbi:FtsX-like permease family protein [Kitasatospora sp. NPDC096147]|uniref:FtsX-like permease family protein n=1 Tax=Kitasatospora sp. NPDC096147 TaxID=3364093 RepID=UPI003830756F